ncbi:MAG: YbjN domain-containing protein [Acidimicrobiaceae bacterium]|jgi:hypothetical protein|nr:YbjN domain-containing protein [Acidimicrobiaceae bacterium]
MSSGPIRQALEEFFAEQGWPFADTAVPDVLETRYGGRTTDWICLAEIREATYQLLFYSIVAERAPAERRTEVAEYTTRANFGLAVGNFELDMNDGEIRFKTSLDVEGAAITKHLVQQIVNANVVVTDLYLPGLLGVLRGQIDPVTAIGMVEPQPDSPKT